MIIKDFLYTKFFILVLLLMTACESDRNTSDTDIIESQNTTESSSQIKLYSLLPVDDTDEAYSDGQRITLTASNWSTAFLKFNLNDFQAIDKAVLKVYADNTKGTTPVGQVKPVENDNWDEQSGLTPKPNINAAMIGESAATEQGGYMTIDISSFVQSQLASDATVTVALNTDQNQWMDFGSKESSNPPELEIYGRKSVSDSDTSDSGSTPDVISVPAEPDSAQPEAPAASNQLPISIINATPGTGTAPVAVNFDAGGSYDPDGDPVTYQWKYGDGTTSNGFNNTHTYTVAGSYTVTLTVTDPQGAASTTTKQIVVITAEPVTEPDPVINQQPVATITTTPLNGDAPVTITISANGSFDPDGSIVNYAWSFGDGSTATGVNTSHRYSNAGNYSITLTVTDNDGAIASATTEVSVNAPQNVNQLPVAKINTTPNQGQAPVTVSVNADSSYDPDGSVVSYAWNFGDGATTTGVSTSHMYNTAGNYIITLTITDNAGAQATASSQISIDSASPSRSLSIMALGDSITQSNSTHQSYRYPLWKKLLDSGIDVDMVGSQTNNNGGNPNWPNYLGKSFDRDHQGHWGQRADQVLNVLKSKSHSPDVVLLHLGTNDEIQGQSSDSTVQDLRSIIGNLRAKNPQVIVLLAKLIPYYGTQQPALNNKLPALAQELNTSSSPVVVVDQNSGFNVNSDTFDRVHPNASGEAKIAQKWFQTILSYVN